MKPWQWSLAAVLCIALLATSACSTLQRGPASPEFTLLAPHTLGAELSVYQQVHWQHQDDSHNLEIALDIRQQSLQMVVMTTLGRRLATLSYEAGHYQLKREPGAPGNIPYQQLLADIQMVFWPLAALNAAASNSGWHFEQQQQRSAWYDGHLIAQINTGDSWSWQGTYEYQNLVAGYQLQLQSVVLP
jgi:hypothetical protein